MKLLRVFPRRTKATPDDEDVRFDPPGLFDEADEIHVSVTFSYDLNKSYDLANMWEVVGNVKIGGPAIDNIGYEFEPGMYLKKGYTITSRGCPNRCWFCDVWKRDGSIRELKIKDGWIIQDDNLLACSDEHIKAVFDMCRKQNRLITFSGGLEAARLKQWHIEEFLSMKIDQFFFAYDTPSDYEPLVCASKMLLGAGYNRYQMRCYVLIGFKGDTFEKAEKRLRQTVELGFYPYAMLYRDYEGKTNREWRKFERNWIRPVLIYKMI